MKIKILLFVGLLTSFSAFAQKAETLVKDVKTLGVFGGPIIEFGQINGEFGADVGGGGALMINNFFFGGYGLGTDYPQIQIEEEDYRLRFKHGGFWLGYTSDPSRVVHWYGSTRLGSGKAQIRGDGPAQASDRIYVVTPEVGIEINLTKFMRLALTGGYRVTTGVSKLNGFDNNDFSSPVGALTFRFGGFASDVDDSDWDWDWDW